MQRIRREIEGLVKFVEREAARGDAVFTRQHFFQNGLRAGIQFPEARRFLKRRPTFPLAVTVWRRGRAGSDNKHGRSIMWREQTRQIMDGFFGNNSHGWRAFLAAHSW